MLVKSWEMRRPILVGCCQIQLNCKLMGHHYWCHRCWCCFAQLDSPLSCPSSRLFPSGMFLFYTGASPWSPAPYHWKGTVCSDRAAHTGVQLEGTSTRLCSTLVPQQPIQAQQSWLALPGFPLTLAEWEKVSLCHCRSSARLTSLSLPGSGQEGMMGDLVIGWHLRVRCQADNVWGWCRHRGGLVVKGRST